MVNRVRWSERGFTQIQMQGDTFRNIESCVDCVLLFRGIGTGTVLVLPKRNARKLKNIPSVLNGYDIRGTLILPFTVERKNSFFL